MNRLSKRNKISVFIIIVVFFTVFHTKAQVDVIETPSNVKDWDISIRFDDAHQGKFYPFEEKNGKLGQVYYKKLDKEDLFYETVPYKESCSAGYMTDDTASRRAKGWYAERKMIEDGKYKILIRGVALADCGYTGSGYVKGEFGINTKSGWKIADIVKCNAGGSNSGQTTYCISDEKSVKFAAGSTCGGCCACADSAGIDIELIMESLDDLSVLNESLTVKKIGENRFLIKGEVLSTFKDEIKNIDIVAYDGNDFRPNAELKNSIIGPIRQNEKAGFELEIIKNFEDENKEIYIYIDPENKIKEANKENNIAKKKIEENIVETISPLINNIIIIISLLIILFLIYLSYRSVKTKTESIKPVIETKTCHKCGMVMDKKQTKCPVCGFGEG